MTSWRQIPPPAYLPGRYLPRLVNGAHVAAAWLGLAAGHEYIHQAVADAGVRTHVESVLASAAGALARRTNEFSAADLDPYTRSVLTRFESDRLPDATLRVGRNPLQKLGPGERLIAPARGAADLGLDISGFAAAIAAILRLDAPMPGMPELREAIVANGWERFIQDHCQLEPGHPVLEGIKSEMTHVAQRRGDNMITEEVLIENPAGLHARPAAEIVECAKAIDAKITIEKGEKSADASSIMAVLALGASTGDTVTVRVEGSDAQAALESIRSIMKAAEH